HWCCPPAEVRERCNGRIPLPCCPHPGGLSSTSAGTGSSQHLAVEPLAYKSVVKFTHVPCKGSGPAIQDVIGGQVDMMLDTTVVAAPHIQSGKLRAIAIAIAIAPASGPVPDVPTVAESGVAELKASRCSRRRL